MPGRQLRPLGKLPTLSMKSLTRPERKATVSKLKLSQQWTSKAFVFGFLRKEDEYFSARIDASVDVELQLVAVLQLEAQACPLFSQASPVCG